MSRARVAVLKVISKELSVTDAAAQYGYSRQHLHRLIARYREAAWTRSSPGPASR
jgi:transposase